MAERYDIRDKVVLITGLLAFLIAGVVITAGQVAIGNPFGDDGKGAIILGQHKKRSSSTSEQDQQQTTTTPQQQQTTTTPQQQTTTTPDQQTTTTPAPTPTATISEAFRPPLAAQLVTSIWVCEPGAVTPNFMPLMSAGPLTFSATTPPSRPALIAICLSGAWMATLTMFAPVASSPSSSSFSNASLPA